MARRATTNRLSAADGLLPSGTSSSTTTGITATVIPASVLFVYNAVGLPRR